MSSKETIRNCDDCRDALAADPTSALVHAHLENCADCREFRDEMRALDARIAKALAVPVPPLSLPDLPDRAPGVAQIESTRRRGLPAAGWLALAASVLAAVALGVRLTGEDVAATSLGEQVLTHIDHEMFSMTVSDSAVSGERLARIVPANVANLGPDAGLVTYAQSCVINGHAVPHLVVQGEQGPVTILLMPDEKLDAPQRIENEELQGVILPVGDGSIAIVGRHGNDLERIEETMRNSVTWRT